MNKQCWIAVLCLGFVSLLGGDGLFAADPERVSLDQFGAKMKKEGWTEVSSGVFERRLGAHKVERLGYGREGFAWSIGELTRKIERLQKEQERYPSAQLTEILEDLRAHLARTKLGLAKLDSEPKAGLASVIAASGSCGTLSYSATADAFASTVGVAAVAKASFNNACGYLGDTYAYAYAHATQGTTTTALSKSDPRTGTSVTSQATAFVNGTTVPGIPCSSEASSFVQSYALGISYSTSDSNSDCGSGSPPQAGVCNLDVRPAATLLLPYFEVDLDNANGINTLFSINNARPEAALAHVVVWSDLSVPVLDFNVYLTGYDVQSISLRDILVNGVLPRTASDGQDPADTISPQGDFSQDINFANCTGQLPPPTLPASFIAHLQNSLTGQSSAILGNRCAGRDLDDRIARGYVTVDTVNNCTLRFPGDPAYFVAGGLGDSTNQNVLWGDYDYVNPGQNFAQGDTLVHIEADATNPETSVPGEYTFYGRYVAWTAADNREPLATNFGVRYLNGGGFDGGTDLLVWRDSKVNQGPFTCPALAGVRPAWYPLGQERIVIFDEQENPDVPTSFPASPLGIIPFPAEAQRTEVGGADFPVPFDFGWLYLNLNTTVTPAGNNPREDPAAAQAWMTVVKDAEGRFSVGHDAVRFDNACKAVHGNL
jgi:hypothetical protein